MPASPADVARFTSDGVVLTVEDLAIRANNPDAKGTGQGEVEMFFDDAADAQIVLDERFALLSRVSALHEGIEVRDDMGLGDDIPYTPNVPCFTIIDDTRSINKVCRTRAVVYEAGSDRYSVEVVE